jgi:hypothetical protein
MKRSAVFSVVVVMLASSCAILSVRLPCKTDKDCPKAQACAADGLCADVVERGGGGEGEGEGGFEGEGEGEGEGEPGTGPGGGNEIVGSVDDGLEFVLRISGSSLATICTDSCSTDKPGSCTPSWSPTPLDVVKNADGSASIKHIPDGSWVIFMDVPAQNASTSGGSHVKFRDEVQTQELGTADVFTSRVDSYYVDVVSGKMQNPDFGCDVEEDGTPADQSVLCTQSTEDSSPPPYMFQSCLERPTPSP